MRPWPRRLRDWLLRRGVGVPGDRDAPARRVASRAAHRTAEQERVLARQRERVGELADLVDIRLGVLRGEPE